MMNCKGNDAMSIEKPVLETAGQTVPLETCTDPDITPRQLAALRKDDVEVYRGSARISGATTPFTRLNVPGGSERPRIVIANGYWASDSAYKQLAAELAIAGNDVVYVKPPRLQNPAYACRPKHIGNVLLLQSQALWSVMKIIDEDSYRLYGHSTGLITAAGVAQQKADRVESLMSAGGAGTTSEKSVLGKLVQTGQLLQHDVYGGREELRRSCPEAMLSDSLWHGVISPVRTVREGLTVARADVRPQLERIRASGVHLGAILFEKDFYYPPDKVIPFCGDNFDAVTVIDGATHIHPQDHPKEHAEEIVAMASGWHPSLAAA